jgi:choline dehydrogenase-like flavoprotein
MILHVREAGMIGDSLKGSTELFDVTVVGSGATGGWAAKELMQAGLRGWRIHWFVCMRHRGHALSLARGAVATTSKPMSSPPAVFPQRAKASNHYHYLAAAVRQG